MDYSKISVSVLLISFYTSIMTMNEPGFVTPVRAYAAKNVDNSPSSVVDFHGFAAGGSQNHCKPKVIRNLELAAIDGDLNAQIFTPTAVKMARGDYSQDEHWDSIALPAHCYLQQRKHTSSMQSKQEERFYARCHTSKATEPMDICHMIAACLGMKSW